MFLRRIGPQNSLGPILVALAFVSGVGFGVFWSSYKQSIAPQSNPCPAWTPRSLELPRRPSEFYNKHLDDGLLASHVKSTGTKVSREDVLKSSRGFPWFQCAFKTNTDKILYHSYESAYDLHLARFQSYKKVKLLEIGLGCDMQYGPGESLKIWLDFFKDVELDLHFLEYNEECAIKWQSSYPKVTFHVGDQADPAVLDRLIKKSGGDFDVIIDDGGHSMKQQIFSMEILIPLALKPGGIYFVEDLTTSIMRPWYADYSEHTAMDQVLNYIIDLVMADFVAYVKRPNAWMHGLLWHIDCFRGICALIKLPKSDDRPPTLQYCDSFGFNPWTCNRKVVFGLN
jgi:hypothetical protein